MPEAHQEFTPRLAVSDSLWSRINGFEALSVLPLFGVEGIVVNPGSISRGYLEMREDKRATAAYRGVLSDLGIEPVAMRDIVPEGEQGRIFAEKERQKGLLERIRLACGMAADLGVDTVSFGSPELRNGAFVENGEDFDVASSFFSEVSKIAGEQGVRVMVESCQHSLGCDIGTTLAEVAEIVTGLEDTRGIGIHLNTSALLMEEEMPKASIAAHGSSSYHAEVCDPFFRTMGEKYLEGHLSIASALGRLRKVGHGPRWITVSGRLEGVSNKHEATSGMIALIQKTRAIYLTS